MLALACLRDAYENDVLTIMDQIERDEKCEDEQTKRLSEIRYKDIAIKRLNILNTEHVNKFLRFSSCQIERENPHEPLVKSLLKDRATVIQETVNNSGSPSVRYFLHLRQCNENIEKGGEPFCKQH